MASPGPLLRLLGTLIVSPSDLGAASPYGGTVLGRVRDVLLMAEVPQFEVPNEDYGPAEWAEVVELGARWELRCNLREWDDDAFGTVFPWTLAGGGRTGVQHPKSGGREPGAQGSGRTVSVLYAANNADEPSIYLRSAYPVLARRLEVNLGQTGDTLWSVRFVGRRDPTTPAGSFQWQKLAELTL